MHPNGCVGEVVVKLHFQRTGKGGGEGGEEGGGGEEGYVGVDVMEGVKRIKKAGGKKKIGRARGELGARPEWPIVIVPGFGCTALEAYKTREVWWWWWWWW